MTMLASSLAIIRDRDCPRCDEGENCPILLNLLNENRKAGNDEREKFFRGGECRYFKKR